MLTSDTYSTLEVQIYSCKDDQFSNSWMDQTSYWDIDGKQECFSRSESNDLAAAAQVSSKIFTSYFDVDVYPYNKTLSPGIQMRQTEMLGTSTRKFQSIEVNKRTTTFFSNFYYNTD